MVPSVPGANHDNNSLDEPSDEESSSSDQQQEPHASPRSSEDHGPTSVPLPRDHSYLLPLRSFAARACSDGDRPSSQDQQYQRAAAPQQERIFQLPILPLFGVVLFPGSTLPVKLRDRSMIRYLVPQLIECSSRRRHPIRRQTQDLSSSSPWPPPPEDVRLGIITLDQESSSMIRHHHQQRHRVSTTTTTATAPLVGTIATIQYTSLQQDETSHVEEQPVNDDHESSSAARSNHQQEATTSMDELIFTAVGTGRFEFIEVISEQDPMIWKVRQLVDGGPFLTYPPMLRQRLWSSGPRDTMQAYDGHGDNDNNHEDVEEEEGEETTTRSRRKVRTHDQVTWNLSLVTPIPHFVYQRYWPWKIVDELMTLLNDPNTVRNGETNLPHLDLRGGKVVGGELSSMSSRSPMEVSYYLAGNMPFTQNERLELLRMPTTLERLLAIRQQVLKLVNQQQTQYLGCAQCELPLCLVRDVFSVEGAEGTTANYVNGHGFIHQVTTIRNVLNHRYIYCEGAASTENRYARFLVVCYCCCCTSTATHVLFRRILNSFLLCTYSPRLSFTPTTKPTSYFPGFSWTVTYCRRCSSLLGWKFQRVSASVASRRDASATNNNNNRSRRIRHMINNHCPDSFFGFQSSSIIKLDPS